MELRLLTGCSVRSLGGTPLLSKRSFLDQRRDGRREEVSAASCAVNARGVGALDGVPHASFSYFRLSACALAC